MWFLEIIFFAVIILYLYFVWKSKYWSRKGVYSLPTKFPFGNMRDFVMGKKHFGEVYDEIYKSFPNAAYVGVYQLLNKPAVLVRDLDLIKNVMVRDFHSFANNEYFIDEKLDPLFSKNPFVAHNEKWKIARSHLAPLFTPGRVKNLFPLINAVCDKFVNYINDEINGDGGDGEFETKLLSSCYTLEVVSSCAFGIDAKILTEKNSEIQQLCDRVFSPKHRSILKTYAALFLPFLNTLLQMPFIHKDTDHWVRTMIRDVIKNRDENTLKRNDFIQSVLDLRNKFDDITEDKICGYALTFLFEGFETSSTLMSFALYELAIKPDIQKIAQNEVDKIMEKYNGVLTDDAASELQYLEAILYETLRLYAPMLVLSKICTKTYELPPQYASDDTRPIIEAGTSILIPVYSIHHDPNVYAKPNKFDPERFIGENKKQHNKYSFLPFGEGPRMCLGIRFGMAQSKAGIATILKNFTINISQKTEQPPQISKTTFLLACDKGIWIQLEKR